MKIRNLIILAVLLCSNSQIIGQNIQLHYDFGKNQRFFTSTIEMFKPDKFGSTYFFVDIDYPVEDGKISLAYFEIARYVTLPLWNKKLDVTAQYNNGLVEFGQLGQVGLFGFSYPVNLGFMEVKTDLLLRLSNYSTNSTDWQVTLAWFKPFLKDKFQFSGFMDIWGEKQEGDDYRVVMYTEPQIWYNIWYNLLIGSEVRMGYNFYVPDKFTFAPTAALKWQF